MRAVWAAVAIWAAVVAGAEARLPESSPRPMPRPGGEVAAPAVVVRPAQAAEALRPKPRESRPTTGAAQRYFVRVSAAPVLRPKLRPVRSAKPARVVEVSSGAALLRVARPEPRPRTPYQQASLSAAGVRSQPSTITRGREGTICRDRGIRGQALAPIPGRVSGCGLARPVRVSSVDGVPLTRPATMDCETARALKTWVAKGVKPTVGRLGGGVGSIKVIADYACRTRNNQPGAKISEHGRGKAVDVAAINLKNGISLSVLKGWDDPVQGKLLRRMHAAACGPFGTVLGPRSDRFHKDHFHLDTASYRSGPYCR